MSNVAVKAALTGDVMNLDMAKEKAWIAFDREEDLVSNLLS